MATWYIHLRTDMTCAIQMSAELAACLRVHSMYIEALDFTWDLGLSVTRSFHDHSGLRRQRCLKKFAAD